MSPPTYYGIEYEINPWMSRSRPSHRQRAEEQWNGLHQVLTKQLAIEVEMLEPVKGLPDMVFTANGGLVWGRKFIASNFRHEVRRGEAPHFENWFRCRGFEILQLPAQFCFEGEGDLLRCGDHWFAGYHIRSDVLAHQKVAELIDREVLSLELTNDWFYHLDTCFCPLGAGRALFYPPAFDAYALQVLENHIAGLIAVEHDEAIRFACNAVVAGDDIVINSGCPEVRKKLEGVGFRVFETSLDEFIKAGGSAKCLVLTLD
jgi:N-dimethylarginine dimethylaminohydrolase